MARGWYVAAVRAGRERELGERIGADARHWKIPGVLDAFSPEPARPGEILVELIGGRGIASILTISGVLGLKPSNREPARIAESEIAELLRRRKSDA